MSRQAAVSHRLTNTANVPPNQRIGDATVSALPSNTTL
jgi:hypothetical protein